MKTYSEMLATEAELHRTLRVRDRQVRHSEREASRLYWLSERLAGDAVPSCRLAGRSLPARSDLAAHTARLTSNTPSMVFTMNRCPGDTVGSPSNASECSGYWTVPTGSPQSGQRSMKRP